MTASGWRKLALAAFVACICVRLWLNRHFSDHSWSLDLGGQSISSNNDDDDSSSSSANSSTDDDDSSGGSASAGDDD